ncbi:hypothetical protein Tco_0641605 [Tanacetum coccineum]
MLESNAYKTYYAFASGEKTPKPKYVRKKVDPDTSPKQNPIQATKGTRLKSKAKVAKSDKKKQPAKKTKAKGLAVLSEVALTKAEQLKLATNRSNKDFHLLHAKMKKDSDEEVNDDEKMMMRLLKEEDAYVTRYTCPDTQKSGGPDTKPSFRPPTLQDKTLNLDNLISSCTEIVL